MPNDGLPNSHLECKQQLLLDCIEEVKDCRKENLLGLFLDSPLQHWDWSCLPSCVTISAVVEYCAISQSGISKLSFLETGYTVNHYNYIRFICIAIIPLICQHLGNGYYWLWMDLESAHYANDTPQAFLRQQSTCFVLKDANSPYVASL